MTLNNINYDASLGTTVDTAEGNRALRSIPESLAEVVIAALQSWGQNTGLASGAASALFYSRAAYRKHDSLFWPTLVSAKLLRLGEMR